MKHQDSSAFPDFQKINHKLKTIIRQTKRLKTLTSNIASKKKTRQVNEEIRQIKEKQEQTLHNIETNTNDLSRIKTEHNNQQSQTPTQSEETNPNNTRTNIEEDNQTNDLTIKEKIKNFIQALQRTGLNPITIMALVITTTTAWAFYTILLLAISIQTIRLTTKTTRIKKYLDLKTNNDDQEDHDDAVLKRRNEAEGDYHPNPTRNSRDIRKLNDRFRENTFEQERLMARVVRVAAPHLARAGDQ